MYIRTKQCTCRLLFNEGITDGNHFALQIRKGIAFAESDIYIPAGFDVAILGPQQTTAMIDLSAHRIVLAANARLCLQDLTIANGYGVVRTFAVLCMWHVPLPSP